MGKIESIEQEIESLPPEELSSFRKWFSEFDTEAWENQIEEDAGAGTLDALAEKALNAFRSGRCTRSD